MLFWGCWFGGTGFGALVWGRWFGGAAPLLPGPGTHSRAASSDASALPGLGATIRGHLGHRQGSAGTGWQGTLRAGGLRAGRGSGRGGESRFPHSFSPSIMEGAEMAAADSAVCVLSPCPRLHRDPGPRPLRICSTRHIDPGFLSCSKDVSGALVRNLSLPAQHSLQCKHHRGTTSPGAAQGSQHLLKLTITFFFFFFLFFPQLKSLSLGRPCLSDSHRAF